MSEPTKQTCPHCGNEGYYFADLGIGGRKAMTTLTPEQVRGVSREGEGMTPDTAKLRELAAKATPGPWESLAGKLHGFDLSVVAPAGDAELGNWLIAGVRWDANAQLIAAMRNELIALLDAADERDRALEKLDATECTLEDEEAAHQETRLLWKAAKTELAALTLQRDELAESRDFSLVGRGQYAEQVLELRQQLADAVQAERERCIAACRKVIGPYFTERSTEVVHKCIAAIEGGS